MNKKNAPDFGEFVEGFALSAWGKIKLLTSRLRDTLCSKDLMLYYILLASFTSDMATDSGTMIYIWYQHFLADNVSRHEHVIISSDEASEYYENWKIIVFFASAVLLPLFGYIADKLPQGREVMFVYGTRGVAIMAFCFMDSPHGWLSMFTLVTLKLCTSLQAITIDSLYTKRLPGDIRASMLAVKGVFGRFGRFSFLFFSLFT